MLFDAVTVECDKANGDLKRLTYSLVEFVRKNIEWNKTNRELLTESGAFCSFEEQRDLISRLQRRVLENKMTVAFVGRSASGKSTILNCLVGDNLLSSSPRHTTPCTISIECTSDEKSFLKIGNDPIPRPLSSLNELSNYLNQDRSNDALHVFLSSQFLQHTALRVERLKLVDTPGWEYPDFDKGWPELEKADVIVIVVDCTNATDHKKIKELLSSLPMVSKSSVFLVFNKVDKLQKEGAEEKAKMRQDILKESVKVLTTDNGVFQSTADAENATYIFSATDATLMREIDSVSKLVQALSSDPTENLGVVCVCGGTGIGKSSLCNQLMATPLLPVSPHSAGRWVICCPTSDSERTCVRIGPTSSEHSLLPGQSLEQLLMEIPEQPVTVYPARELLQPASILLRCDQLVDSPSYESVSFETHGDFLGKAQSVIILVSGIHPTEIIQTQILRNVQLIIGEKAKLKSTKKAQIFLVVSMWEKLQKKVKDVARQNELKGKIRTMFCQLTRDFQPGESSMKRVFFMSLKNGTSMEESAQRFSDFERRLLVSAKEQYLSLKIISLKQELMRVATDFNRLRLEGYCCLKDSKPVCNSLKDIKAAIGNSNGKMCASNFFNDEYHGRLHDSMHQNSGFEEDSPVATSGDASREPFLQEVELKALQMLPQSDDEKQAALEQFYRYLLTDPFGDVDSIGRSIQRRFDDRPEAAQGLVRSLCLTARNNVLQKLRASETATIAALQILACVDFSDLQHRQRRLGVGAGVGLGVGGAALGGVGAGVGAGIGTLLAGAEIGAEVGAVAGLAAGPLGAVIGVAVGTSIGLISGAVTGILIGRKIHADRRVKLRDLTFADEQQFLFFLEIFHDRWLAKCVTCFDEQLSKLACAKAQEVEKCARQMEGPILKFNREFTQHRITIADGATKSPSGQTLPDLVVA